MAEIITNRQGMVVFYSDDRRYAPKFQYLNGELVAHPEVPERAESLLAACQQLGLSIHTVTDGASVESLTQVHSPSYIDYLRVTCTTIPEGDEIFAPCYVQDTYTPLNPHTYEAATISANLAIRAATAVLGRNRAAYALCRPPGHHALPDAMGGFCYFNNAALAAHKLSRYGKVAILDIDYHHGNGTQQIFYNRPDVLYVSLHADPSYDFPHTSGSRDELDTGNGRGFTHNYPLPKHTTPAQYLKTLGAALTKVKAYSPSFIVLSLGFDTYKDDPIAGFNLDETSYHTIGSLLACELPLPTAIIQEGGYNVEKLSSLAKQFLTGYLGQNRQ